MDGEIDGAQETGEEQQVIQGGEAAGGGANGLEPVGASKGEGDEVRRWYEIAGIIPVSATVKTIIWA